MKKNIILFLFFLGVFSVNFSFAQEPTQLIAPENIEQAKEVGEKAMEVTKKELPGTLEKIWKEEILPMWQKMWYWFKINVWAGIQEWFKEKIEPRAKEEIIKKTPAIQEEIEKEGQEIVSELPAPTQSLGQESLVLFHHQIPALYRQ